MAENTAMDEKKKLETITAIAERAEALKLVHTSRLTTIMDLELADKHFHLRLDDLLKAEDIDFAHDIVGIQKNINRLATKFDNGFVPRYSGATA